MNGLLPFLPALDWMYSAEDVQGVPVDAWIANTRRMDWAAETRATDWEGQQRTTDWAGR